MASLPAEPLTEEQYLHIERQAETKSEFHDGQMFGMAGGSPNHALLANRIGALLDRQVPAGCRTFNADLRVKIEAAGLYMYADCSVVCGELEYSGDRTIQSFQEYLLVHPDRQRVERYSRQDDGSWLLRDYAGGTAMIGCLNVGIVLAELYASAPSVS
jgi:Uma2 family endonuclease